MYIVIDFQLFENSSNKTKSSKKQQKIKPMTRKTVKVVEAAGMERQRGNFRRREGYCQQVLMQKNTQHSLNQNNNENYEN